MITKSRLLFLIAILFACACDNPQGKSNVADIVIDSTKVFLPVIKVKLNSNQKNMLQQKTGGETISGLFIVNDNKPSPYSVTVKYWQEADTLYYTPKLKLGNGLEFEIQLYTSHDTLRKRFSTPSVVAGKKSGVENIYPLTDTVPDNILMFHVRFQTPMVEDPRAFKKIRLVDEKGEEKQKVWREKSNWTEDGRNLVLMIHPGRVKRGIEYVKEQAVLFEEGKSYTLIIPAEMKDKSGNSLAREYTKTFVVSRADREIPLFQNSKLTPPPKNTQEPITLSFSEPIDYGTAQIGIAIFAADKKKLQGKLTALTDKKWFFIPKNPWKKGKYTIVINDYLTDLASNHFTQKFEVKHLDSLRNRRPLNFEFVVY